MKKLLSELKHFKTKSTEDSKGKIEDFYFDEKNLTIRYLRVSCGSFLNKSEVLLSPISIRGVNSVKQTVDFNLSDKQIEDAPSADFHKPLSRQFEEKYFQHFNWPLYWYAPGPWIMGPYGRDYRMPNDEMNLKTDEFQVKEEYKPEDRHLRSFNEVCGYHIRSQEKKEFGRVDDFVINLEDWTLSHLVVKVSSWLPSKKVAVPARLIEEISLTDRDIDLPLKEDVIKELPEIDLACLEDEESFEVHKSKLAINKVDRASEVEMIDSSPTHSSYSDNPQR